MAKRVTDFERRIVELLLDVDSAWPEMYQEFGKADAGAGPLWSSARLMTEQNARVLCDLAQHYRDKAGITEPGPFDIWELENESYSPPEPPIEYEQYPAF